MAQARRQSRPHRPRVTEREKIRRLAERKGISLRAARRERQRNKAAYAARVARGEARGLSRQQARGHQPDEHRTRIVRAQLASVAALSDQEAVTQIQRRLKRVFPNSENYDDPFIGLSGMPDAARALLTVSDSDLRMLIHDPNRENTGVRFAEMLQRLTRLRINEIPSVNPLFYHSSNRTDYGI
jgi:hypothetical protein